MAGPPLPPPPKLGQGTPPPVAPGAGGNAAESMTGPGAGGPISSPMTTPQPMEGMQKGARIQVQVASEMLQRELPHFPLDSEEFKAISGALKTIQGAFGKSKDEDRRAFPAEILNMLSAVGPGSASPGAKVMAGAPPAPPGGQPPQPPPMA